MTFFHLWKSNSSQNLKTSVFSLTGHIKDYQINSKKYIKIGNCLTITGISQRYYLNIGSQSNHISKFNYSFLELESSWINVEEHFKLSLNEMRKLKFKKITND